MNCSIKIDNILELEYLYQISMPPGLGDPSLAAERMDVLQTQIAKQMGTFSTPTYAPMQKTNDYVIHIQNLNRLCYL